MVISAVRAPRPSRMVLVATVVPWASRRPLSGSMPSAADQFLQPRHDAVAVIGNRGRGTFRVRTLPSEDSSTMSVNVPPISTPIRCVIHAGHGIVSPALALEHSAGRGISDIINILNEVDRLRLSRSDGSDEPAGGAAVDRPAGQFPRRRRRIEHFAADRFHAGPRAGAAARDDAVRSHGHRAVLTDAGRDLVRYAERILALAEEMELRSAGAHTVVGAAAAGCGGHFCAELPAGAADGARAGFSRPAVDLQVDYSFQPQPALAAGRAGYCVPDRAGGGAAIAVEPLAELTLGWVASPRLGLPARVLAARSARPRRC